MKKHKSHRKNIRFTIAAKLVVLAAILVFLWDENEIELYASETESKPLMVAASDEFLEDLGGSTGNRYYEGWPDGGRPLKKLGW